MKGAKVTLSLDLTNPQRLTLFPLIFAYNHVSTEVSRALRLGNMENVMSLQTPLNELRQELERRGVLGYFIELKGIENQALLERAKQTNGEQGARICKRARHQRDSCQDENGPEEVPLALNACGSVRRVTTQAVESRVEGVYRARRHQNSSRVRGRGKRKAP